MPDLTTAARAQSARRDGASARTERFRPDIQGLRAIAVAAVVLYHGRIPFVSGGYVGVDLFFVISGYLITAHLLRGMIDTGKLDFGTFYARRARRILPAAFAVVALTLAAAFFLVPPAQLRQAAIDAIWTVFYVPNLAFAHRGTDYLAQSDAPSLFQHYWSLGVEEQFYLFWPLLLVVFFAVARRSKRALAAFLLVVGALSLWACIAWTPTANSWAYFSIPARAWEFMVGGLVALALSTGVTVGRRTATLLGWLGIIGIAVSIFAYDDATQFPGVAAMLPVLATGAVILGGAGGSGAAPFRLLGTAPLAWIGEISYSLYLVHWPVLTIAQAYVGSTHPIDLLWRSVLVLACVPLAWGLYRFVENPVRRARRLTAARPRVSLVSAAGLTVLLTGASLGTADFAAHVPQSTGTAIAADNGSLLSTAPHGSAYVPKNLVPSLATAAADNPILYSDGCHLEVAATVPKSCMFGTNTAAPRVVLFGDSHAAQWFPALDTLAEKGEIYLQVETKTTCPAAELTPLITQGSGPLTPYPECAQWRNAVLAQLAVHPPAAVVLGELTREPVAGKAEASASDWSAALAKTLAALPSASKKLVVGDNPYPGQPPSNCLSAHVNDAHACDLPRATATSAGIDAVMSATATEHGADYLSTVPHLCGASTCPVIISNVLVYRDGTHVTATYARLVAPLFETALRDRLGLRLAG